MIIQIYSILCKIDIIFIFSGKRGRKNMGADEDNLKSLGSLLDKLDKKYQSSESFSQEEKENQKKVVHNDSLLKIDAVDQKPTQEDKIALRKAKKEAKKQGKLSEKKENAPVPTTVTKSKAELKRERREKQEAQRAAKSAEQVKVKVISDTNLKKEAVPLKETKVKVVKKKEKVSVLKENRLMFFSHLVVSSQKSFPKDTQTSYIHPAIRAISSRMKVSYVHLGIFPILI